MCLALPARMVSVTNEGEGVVEIGGVRQRVSTALLDDVREGDWVVVHVGHAISRLDPEEAARTLALAAGIKVGQP